MLYNKITKSDKFFKGWYSTPTDLQTSLPIANAGDYAIVASTNTIWIWSEAGNVWQNSGQSPTQSYIPKRGLPLSGNQNSSNKVFTVSEDFVPGTTRVYVNGISAFELYDYNETGLNERTFVSFTPTALDKLRIDYSILPT